MNASFSKSIFGPVAAVLSLLAGPGCSLPKPEADPTRFYVLSTAAAGTAVSANAPAVQLKQVELASYLRARPLIVRRGNNEIEFREFARWGEPLELGIERVLREELIARGAAGAVMATSARRDKVAYDYVLTVRVLACEGAAGGGVVFRAVWELASEKKEANPGTVVSGDFRPTDLRWDGKTEASLAAQLSQAVAGLAAEVAAALGRSSR